MPSGGHADRLLLGQMRMRENFGETDFPVAGGTMQVHVLRDGSRTVFRLDEKRSAMFEGPAGILVHDRRGSHFLIPDVVQALRDLRIMRNLLAVEIEDGEPRARRTKRLLLQACLASWLAHRKKGKLPERFLAMFERIYIRILEERSLPSGLGAIRTCAGRKAGSKEAAARTRSGRGLAERKDEFLRFAHDLSIPSAPTRPSRTSVCANCSRRSPAAAGP